MNAVIFAFFWLLFVVAQAQNSIRSTANGLDGWTGFKKWLALQAVNLTTRASFSAVLYNIIIASITAKVQSVGMPFTSAAIAAIGGYAANAMLYQIFGYLPWLRVEIHDLVPPSEQQPTSEKK